MLLPIHIAAGGLAIVLGAVALSAKKGGIIHRRSGVLFVYAMLVMGVSASLLSVLGNRDTPFVAHVLRPVHRGGSFFSLEERVAQILPEPFTTGPMRALPIVLLSGAMFYWLWRVRGRRTLPATRSSPGTRA